MGRKVQKKAYRGFLGYVIFPILFINSYAFWKLYQTAGHWSMSLMPDSLPAVMTHLAVILSVNSIVILALVFYIKISN
jgi:hypothetical protein